MSLTGVPLLVACWLGTKLVVGLTIIGWRYGGRVRLLTRTVSILACEAVLLFTFGVAANRALDLYPSWAVLLHPVPKPKSVETPVGRLDGWLRAQDAQDVQGAQDGAHGVTFTWQPPGWTSWGLAGAPKVFVPPAYFAPTGTGLHFPAIVVVTPAGSGDVTDPIKATTQAIAVVVHPARAGDAGTLADELPYALNLDLRVNPHGWALIGAGADERLVLAVLGERPERYQEAALIVDGPAPPVATVGRQGYPEQQVRVIAGQVSPTARLAAALSWVYGLLPAPLNAPETGPIGIPPKPKPRPQPSTSQSTL